MHQADTTDARPHPARELVIGLFVVLVALIAFAFRFLSFRGLTNDHYMHLAWAQQMILGELPGRDFVDPGMPLAVVLSALAQLAWRSPVSEGLLSIGMLAIAAAITCLLVTRVTASLTGGVTAAIVQVALYPRLYSFPKILVPVITVYLVWRYARVPTTRRIAALAAWTTLAFLLRHDLGIAATVAALAGILIAHAGDWRIALLHAGRYVAIGLLMVAPYLVFVEATEGVAEHLRVGAEFSKSDSHQVTVFGSPAFPLLESGGATSWSEADATAVLFWTTHVILVALAGWLAMRWREPGPRAALYAATLAFLVLYRLYILRHPFPVRVADLAGVLTIAGAIGAAECLRFARLSLPTRPITALSLAAATTTLVLAFAGSTWTLSNIGGELEQTDLALGVTAATHRAREVIEDGTGDVWPRYWPAGDVPRIVNYLSACTTADDRVLITWTAPEYYFFSARGFAAGHAWFLHPRAFVTAEDQARMLARLRAQSVPIALVNDSQYETLAAALPALAGYLEGNYVRRGAFASRDGSQISIRVRADLVPLTSFSEEGWPCLFDRAAATSVVSFGTPSREHGQPRRRGPEQVLLPRQT